MDPSITQCEALLHHVKPWDAFNAVGQVFCKLKALLPALPDCQLSCLAQPAPVWPLVPLIIRDSEESAVSLASIKIASGRDMPVNYPIEKVELARSGARASLQPVHKVRERHGARRFAMTDPHTAAIVHSRRVPRKACLCLTRPNPAPCNANGQEGRRTVKKKYLQ